MLRHLRNNPPLKIESLSIMKVGIISAGAWGTAIAKILAHQNHDICVYSSRQEVVQGINIDHVNTKYLLGVDLPHNIQATQQLTEAAEDKDVLLLSVPSSYLLKTLEPLLSVPSLQAGQCKIGILTKGFIESDTGPQLITDALEALLPKAYQQQLVYITGPAHAEEVARLKLTGLVSASLNKRNAVFFRDLLNSPSLKIFPSFDVVGVQVCAALKNVVAIAFGMMDALKQLSELFGDNTESLLLSAGLSELQMLGMALGGKVPETYASIAGVGDLDVTCRSRYGRNRRFGLEVVLNHVIERFQDMDDLIAHSHELGYLVEGITATKFTQQLCTHKGLRLPICQGVFRILNREQEPLEALQDILDSV